jgi:hypothetical protein
VLKVVIEHTVELYRASDVYRGGAEAGGGDFPTKT